MSLTAGVVFSLVPISLPAVPDGAGLSLAWALPFAGILLSIAVFPILFASFWHHHFGKIVAAWTLSFLLPFAVVFGTGRSMNVLAHAFLVEYLPFVTVLLTLFIVSGGIVLRGNLHGSPERNTALLLVGVLLASVMGTTGAAMLLIRPLIKANANRRHNAHVILFFIFLVANIGGGLSPLGDPPLFLGYLKGVAFDWPLRHLFAPVLFSTTVLLLVFFVIDRYYYRLEGIIAPDPDPDIPFHIAGRVNVLLLAVTIATVLMSGMWSPGIAFDVAGTRLAAQDVVRDAILLAVSAASLCLTSRRLRVENGFEWAPIAEVAKLFAGIFVTIAPVIAILHAGERGALSGLAGVVTHPSGAPWDARYFWLTGILSSLLDNAPTYLVFFNLASGDAAVLSGPLSTTLLAISMGAVFMGAATYIGNAPNFMVKAIAERAGIRMPGFFRYLLWSGSILLPLFAVLTLLFF
ncbi:sodium:proton antiporter [Paludibacterium yongneupense]|uniref:sodium:proton antiporter n=1 Tax=Paludibacterium yongneupense TaxID=400061 RepID=UPI00041B8581|nr:sodium:proton antiporter [Paludibacterium yongneupense]